MKIKLRKFKKADIPYKVKWINDSENNKYLHYDLPLSEAKTLVWYNSIKEKKDRLDYTITCNDEPVGIIGLINVDNKNKKSEYYVTLGEKEYRGLGIAYTASNILIEKAFNEYNLNKIYLYTEVENLSAQKLFEKIGFIKEGLLKEDLIVQGKKVDRFFYGLLSFNYINEIGR